MADPWLEPLPAGVSLQVWLPGGTGALPAPVRPLFESQGKWLHPLFELADFLAIRPEIQPNRLILSDRIIGRAAAFLILHLGISQVHTDLASRRATSLLAGHQVQLTAARLVDRLDCQTEDLLEAITESAIAMPLLAERRRMALQCSPITGT